MPQAVFEAIPSDQNRQDNINYLVKEEGKRYKRLCSHYWMVKSTMRL